VQDTFSVAEGITAIDTRMVGRYLVTSAYLVAAAEPALIETGPQTSSEAVLHNLDRLGYGPADLAHIVVTHVHLDHAGGAGTIAERFPNATVWVSERGARHLADPTRLVESTARAYGPDRMREMFGFVEPIAAERLRALADGDVVPLGDRALEAMYTPGHASHHVALRDAATGAVFTGDALGVHLPDVRVLRPATPPPDFDLELARASIERIRTRADLLLLSHFGPVAEVDHLCELATRRLLDWSDDVRAALEVGAELDRVVEILERRGAAEYREDSGQPIDLERYDVLSSIRMNATGMIRYWQKRAERAEAELSSVPLAVEPDADQPS
jgi:glyoxylase-like metal-dependent hydrolase (beta-lactamase superfamily II)